MTIEEQHIKLMEHVLVLQDTVIHLQGVVLAQGNAILSLNKLVEKKAIDIIMPRLEAAMKAGADKAKEN
jgi:hypothetical protein